MQSYEGRYATIAGVVNVTKKSDYLRAEVMDTALRLVPRTDGLLGLRYKLLGLFQISLGQVDYDGFSVARVAGRDIVKVRSQGRELLLGERIKLVPLSEKWLKRTGEYEIINRGDDAVLIGNVRLRLDNGLLIIDYAMPLFIDGRMSVAITPLSDTEVIMNGLGRNMGETIRVVNVAGEELLQYSGYLLRKKELHEASDLRISQRRSNDLKMRGSNKKKVTLRVRPTHLTSKKQSCQLCRPLSFLCRSDPLAFAYACI